MTQSAPAAHGISDPPQTIVIVGGVAGGASAAARLRRLNETAHIIVLERSGHVSFANCGLPYHLSGTISDRESLLLQTPESLWQRFRLDVRVQHEVVGIDAENKRVTARNLRSGALYDLDYDAMVLSPGATPIVPPIPGRERGLVLRNIEDLDQMLAREAEASDVVIVGAGFIGLEAAENLAAANRSVTIVELGRQVLAPLDPEMAEPILAELNDNGVSVKLGTSVAEIGDETVTLSDGTVLPADLVLFSIGVRPDVQLAKSAALELGPHGGIAVDQQMRTSAPGIWAVGDAVEKSDLLADEGESALMPLANIANREGRRAADSIMGRTTGVEAGQATAIVQVFGLTAAVTGWNEKKLRAANRPFLAIHTHALDHAGYYPGASTLRLKLLLAPDSGAILGAEAVGAKGADKRIDVLATAIRGGLTGPDLLDLELAYAPPFGSAKDPINQLGYISENRLSGLSPSVDFREVEDLQARGWQALDVRDDREVVFGMIPGAIQIPVNELRDRLDELPDAPTIVYCAVGQRAHVAQQLLQTAGLEVRNLDGGWSTWQAALAAGLVGQTPASAETIVATNG
ncbi:MAG: FAD-dependent oxidoreductase [Actinomycetia bacterium]|nr:FAD-dependent oxidoreductase [Actinomycetes bacterium]